MGIYFIAAGKSSRNREKSLDKGFRSEELRSYMKSRDFLRLEEFFCPEETIYVWGANKGRSFNELQNVSPDEYVVDVKNKEVMTVFKFCFFIDTGTDKNLQNYIGWDIEKPPEQRRPYRYVFFLKNPKISSSSIRKKDYFQSAFKENRNLNWLVGQRWFSSPQLHEAIKSKKAINQEAFLGISIGTSNSSVPDHEILDTQKTTEEKFTPPELLPIIKQVKALHMRQDHKERDHEDLVKEFFKFLGYRPIEEIRFQQGRIDILISINNSPLITIEVKRDWGLSNDKIEYLDQAFRYALRTGTRYVAITNGDKYYFYDQDMGRSYGEKFMGQFELTRLTTETVKLISILKKESLTVQ